MLFFCYANSLSYSLDLLISSKDGFLALQGFEIGNQQRVN